MCFRIDYEFCIIMQLIGFPHRMLEVQGFENVHVFLFRAQDFLFIRTL